MNYSYQRKVVTTPAPDPRKKEKKGGREGAQSSWEGQSGFGRGCVKRRWGRAAAVTQQILETPSLVSHFGGAMLGLLGAADPGSVDASANLLATECQEKVSHEQHNLICARVTTSLYGSAICPRALGGTDKSGSECHWDSTNTRQAAPASEGWEPVANAQQLVATRPSQAPRPVAFFPGSTASSRGLRAPSQTTMSHRLC